MSTRLRFSSVISGDEDNTTVDFDGVAVTLPTPNGFAPAAGDIVWLLQSGYRMHIVGTDTPAIYDNPRAFDAPLTYDGR